MGSIHLTNLTNTLGWIGFQRQISMAKFIYMMSYSREDAVRRMGTGQNMTQHAAVPLRHPKMFTFVSRFLWHLLIRVLVRLLYLGSHIVHHVTHHAKSRQHLRRIIGAMQRAQKSLVGEIAGQIPR